MLNYLCLVNTQTNLNTKIIKLKEVNKSYYLIGRKTDCDIMLNSPLISRVHCTLISLKSINSYFSKYQKNHGFLLIDGYFGKPISTNGVYVNGEKIHNKVLENHDKIEIGAFTFVYKQEKTDETEGGKKCHH